MKKTLFLFVVNIFAISSLVITILSNFDLSLGLQLAIPILVLCGTNLFSALSIMANSASKKENRTTDGPL